MEKTEYNLIGNTVLIKKYKDTIFTNSYETKITELDDEVLKKELSLKGYAYRIKDENKLDSFENKLKGAENKVKEIEKKVEEITNEELHPDRYGGDTPYETKKVAEAWHTAEQYEGWILITLEKYLSRFGKKDDKVKEAKKILNYAQFLLEFEEKHGNK